MITRLSSRRSALRWLLSGLTLGLVLILAGGFLSARAITGARASSAAVLSAIEVVDALQAIDLELARMVASSRGVLLLQDDRQVEGMIQARDSMYAILARVRAWEPVSGRVPAGSLDHLEDLLARRAAISEEAARLARTDPPAAEAFLRSANGPPLTDSARMLLGTLMGSRRQTVLMGQVELRETLHRSLLLSTVVTLGGVVLVLLAVGIAVREGRRRRKAEAGMEATLRYLDATADAVYVFEPERLRLTHANEGAVRQSGYPSEELVGLEIPVLLPGTGEEGLRALLAPLAAGGEPATFETVSRRKDGGEVPVEVVVRHLSGNGVKGRFIAAARDVSERKRLTEERDRFFSLSSDLLCVSDARGRFVYASPAVTEILGWSPEEFLALPYLDQIHPDDHAATLREVERQLERGESVFHFENRYRHKDGSWRVLSWNAMPHPDGLSYGIARDVTDQKRLARDLQLILDASAAGVYGVDAEGRCTFMNRTGARLLGYDPEDIVGRNTHDLFHHHRTDGTPYPVTECPLHRGITETLAADVDDEVFWRGDGTSVPVEYRVRAVRDPHQGLGAVVTFNDITERKRTEEALRSATAAAEAANRAKSQFLANMSHELRTPLNSIIGFSEMLEDQAFGELNARQARYVSNVLTSGRHLLDLINDILDLAKIESGRLQLQVEPLDVERVVAGTLEVVRGLAHKRGVTLGADVQHGLPSLHADPAKVKQVLYNLLSNAVKFTPAGGSVSVRAETVQGRPGSGPLLRVSVADTGIGIKPVDHTRVWEEFVQVDSSYARQEQGTGLGLALTKRLVEAHGGRIWLESEGVEGRGSTFAFELPIAPPPARATTGPLEFAGTTGEGPLVLVVDDDPGTLELLAGYLQTGGYSVACARTAAEALEMARTLAPFAITLDILLPDRTGWEVLRDLRSETRDVPVVVVTITEDRQLGLSLGAVEFLSKPVRREELLSALETVARHTGRAVASVLVVDDDPISVAPLIAGLHKEGVRVLTAESGRAGIELARSHRPDALILDLLMPGMDGFEVVDRLRADPRTEGIPILIHTGLHLTPEQHARLHARVQGISAKSRGDALLADLARLRVRAVGAPAGEGT